jgi:hypothetical protein
MQKDVTVFGFIFAAVALAVIGYFIYHQSGTPIIPSSFSLTTPVPSISPTEAPEPLVTEWTTYSNDKYNFTLEVPANWYQREYTPASGGLLVAFSPMNNLPCENCSYVHDGFFSLKIYNNTTDAQAYSQFTTRMGNAGQSTDYRLAQIAGIKGVIFGNTAAIENHGWVYEFSLDNNNGNENATDSQLFQKFATSLKFTYLIFDN